ncbi:MAG: nucleotide exchange factor GrpE, partial [Sedimentisphaerales bacterium]|nr:nucleotide exchange factor GrpE [Sedimentisphaerales bacterium]
ESFWGKPMKKKDTEKKENSQEDSKELHETIEALQKEKDEVFEKLQRISADYANFQKRVPRQISDSINYEKERIIKSLLPVLDNFEHTILNTKNSENVDILAKGVQIIYDQMLDILKSHGVEQLITSDQKFDPSKHEAMILKNDPDKEDNIVLEEYQKGYKLNERVIRPSKVVVNKLPVEQAAEQEEIEQDNIEEEPDTTDTEQ